MSKPERKIGFDISYYDATGDGTKCEYGVTDKRGKQKPCGRKAAHLVCFNTDNHGDVDNPTTTFEVHLCKSHVVKTGLVILAIMED